MQYPSLTRSHGAPHRVRADGPDPADGRAHRQHRPGRAARHRDHATTCPTEDGEADPGTRPGQGQRRAPSASGSSTPPPRSPASPDEFEPADRDLVRAVVRSLDDALVEEREERVVLAGTANLARVGTDFPLSIGPVLEALEQHVVLLKLLGTAPGDLRRGRRCGSGTRTRSPGCSRPPSSRPSTARAPSLGRRARRPRARPGWTTPRRWRRCGPWPPTSPGSSRSDARPTSHHRPSPPAPLQ